MKFSTLLSFTLLTYGVVASPLARREVDDLRVANAREAIRLNKKFESMTPDASCILGEIACIGGKLAQCHLSDIGFEFVLNECPTGLSCYALPLMARYGTAVTCSSEFSKDRIILDSLGDDAETQAQPKEKESMPLLESKVTTYAAGSIQIFTSTKQFSFPAHLNILRKRASKQEFLCDNGKLAQAKAKEFKSLKANDPCTNNDVACIGTKFAQCANGRWNLSDCAAQLECAALPLLLKPGVSITCDTPEDAKVRVSNALANCPAQGKPPGKGKPPAPTPTSTVTPSAQPTSPSSPPDDIATIRKLNADDAVSLAKKFSSLTPDSPCNPGDTACVKGAFAQCVGQADGSGKFLLTECASPTKCVVLPLALKRGTSLTCDTEADLAARLEEARKNL